MGDYVVFHASAWSGTYSIYFFVIGLSGALFFFSTLSWFRAEFAVLRRDAFYLSFVLLLVGGLVLVADLSQPLRFLYTLNPAYWNMTSPLVWGSILLVLFGLASVLYYLALRSGNEKSARTWGVVGSVVALGLPIYTGFDLSVHQHRPVWNTPLMPVLFVALSLLSGAAVSSFLAKGEAGLLGVLRKLMLWSAGATAVMLLSLFVTTAYGGSAEELTQLFMTTGTLGLVFVGLGLIAGTAVPIVLLLAPLGRQQTGLWLAAALLLVGGLALRYAIVVGPQIVQTFYS